MAVSGLRSSWAMPAASCPRAASCSVRSTANWLSCKRLTTVAIWSAMFRRIASRFSMRKEGTRSIGPITSLSLPLAARIGT